MPRNIPFNLGNAPGIAIQESINNNLELPSPSGFVAACPVVARKGFPFTILNISKNNFRDILGEPLSSNEPGWEYMRQLYEALQGAEIVKVVRVVPDASVFNYIVIKEDGTVDKTQTSKFSASVTISSFTNSDTDNEIMLIYQIDGSDSNRKVLFKDFTTDNNGENIFTVEITEENGVIQNFTGSYKVGVNDDEGRSRYFPDVFERESSIYRCLIPSIDGTNLTETRLNTIFFSGMSSTILSDDGIADADYAGHYMGENSNSQGLPNTADFTKASGILSNTIDKYDALFTCGNRTAINIKELIDIANNRRLICFYDLTPGTSYPTAITNKQTLSINEKRAFCLFVEFSCDDFFEELKKVFIGGSGAAVLAAANGYNVRSGGVPGVHLAPAGITRGSSIRTGIITEVDDTIPGEEFFSNRINYYAKDNNTAGWYIYDVLTSTNDNNTNRLFSVVNIDNYLAIKIFDAVQIFQFQPSSSNIINTITDLLVDQVFKPAESSGALHGSDPYKISIKLVSSDKIEINYSITPVGSIRRIEAQPIILNRLT